MNDKCKVWENVDEVIIEEIESSHKKGENIQASNKSEKERKLNDN